ETSTSLAVIGRAKLGQEPIIGDVQALVTSEGVLWSVRAGYQIEHLRVGVGYQAGPTDDWWSGPLIFAGIVWWVGISQPPSGAVFLCQAPAPRGARAPVRLVPPSTGRRGNARDSTGVGNDLLFRAQKTPNEVGSGRWSSINGSSTRASLPP